MEFQTHEMGVQSRTVEQMMDELNEVIERYDNLVMVSTVIGCLEILKTSLIAGHAYDPQ
jgi:hypothetical protein